MLPHFPRRPVSVATPFLHLIYLITYKQITITAASLFQCKRFLYKELIF